MFWNILKYELKFWLKQPAFYFYSIFFFSLSCVTMWGMASESNYEVTHEILNSPYNIFDFSTRRFFMLFLFVLPGVIGYSIFRDFKSEIHTLLFSFPFSKKDYLLAKFLSGFIISLLIGLSLLLGFMVGFELAGGTDNHLNPIDLKVYLKVFFIFIIPNTLIYSVLIFGITLFSRNIFFGYISILLLILSRKIISIILNILDKEYLSALLEPLGIAAIRIQTKSWNVADKNVNLLPTDGLILYNRFLWVFISVGIFLIIYKSFSFGLKSKKITRNKIVLAQNSTSIFNIPQKVNLPKINFNFNLSQQWKSMFKLGYMDFKFIIKSWMFRSVFIIGTIAIILILAQANPRFGVKSLPTTEKMLAIPMIFFSGLVNLLTFLYAGMLIHRSKFARMSQMVDISPLSNWAFLGSKLFALTLMQFLLVSILMISGIVIQIYNGFYQLELGHYFFELYFLNMLHFFIWSILALFILSIFKNPFLGFFILIITVIGFIFGGQLFTELGYSTFSKSIFRYNQVPGAPPEWLQFSAMDGYGTRLQIYLTYKLYWLFFAALFFIGSLLMYQRNMTQTFKERLILAKHRFSKTLIGFSVFFISLFFLTGFKIYNTSGIGKIKMSILERKKVFEEAEKKYAYLNKIQQPTIKKVSIDMDIFPTTRNFKANGNYIIINETSLPIDTLILSYVPDFQTKYSFNQPTQDISKDNIAQYLHLDILKLDTALQPGDSLKMSFSASIPEHKFLQLSYLVKSNGTMIEDDIFPQFGNWLEWVREENHWSNLSKGHPNDSSSWNNKGLNRISFETTISTSKSQTAIAPGSLINSWTKNNRNYFHYKTQNKIAHAFLFLSGKYEIEKETWNGVELEIYYHKNHPYNIKRIMDGKLAALEYCSKNFSPYPYNQLRTVEFSQVGASSAHGFPGVIPTGEGVGFIADISDKKDSGTDFAFGTSVHETAHQWWGNEVLAIDIIGFKMVIESMAEYVNVMIKKHKKGMHKTRKYLQKNMDIYLKGRNYAQAEEQVLMYTSPTQNHIHYAKGAVIFYAISDYIGEENLNKALSKFIHKVKEKSIPSTSIEMVNLIREVTPDSLQYIIEDMFETVTLYDNQMIDAATTHLSNGKYQIDLEFLVSKYRSINHGQRSYIDKNKDSLSYTLPNGNVSFSYPLKDYIEVGLFDNKGNEIYLQKHLIQNIHNKISIIIDVMPERAGIDPYLKLIDSDRKDNVIDIK